MIEKIYTFTQEQLEAFILYVWEDMFKHPRTTPKGTIRRLYKKK
jgi:hypothetical protein